MSAATVMVRLDSLPQDVVEKIMAAAESPNLPTVTTTDNDDVLMVVKGKWAKKALTGLLPAVTADDNGKVLKVVEGAWAAVLETPAAE